MYIVQTHINTVAVFLGRDHSFYDLNNLRNDIFMRLRYTHQVLDISLAPNEDAHIFVL